MPFSSQQPHKKNLKDHTCQVMANQNVGNQLYILTLKTNDPDGFYCRAGQFVMIDMPTPVFYFRRPMSVLAVHDDGRFDVFYKVHGQGTQIMAQWQPGIEIQVLGPLGNTFTPPTEPETALLIGGGIGIAPLYMLGQEIKNRTENRTPNCYYGVRSHQEVGLKDSLEAQFGSKCLHLSSDDGSVGFHGNVGDLLKQNRERVQAAKEAYICGPTVMMEACFQLLREMNPAIRVEVSLEERMPCGTGACTGCVVFRSDQPLPSKVCVEGPVFDATTLIWRPSAPLSPEENIVCSR